MVYYLVPEERLLSLLKLPKRLLAEAVVGIVQSAECVESESDASDEEEDGNPDRSSRSGSPGKIETNEALELVDERTGCD